MENNLTTAAFTPERLELIKALSTQAAISIENARLYSELEEKVFERTRALSEANVKLRATQEQMIHSEKLASLGQLVAGIAHEINTPMGAIRGSIDNLSTSMDRAVRLVPETFRRLTPHEISLFFEMVRDSLRPELKLTSREERAVTKKLTQELEARGLPGAEGIAERLTSIGVADRADQYIELLRGEETGKILELAYLMSRQARSTETMRSAIERVSKIVFALKNFSHMGGADEMVLAAVQDGLETVIIIYQNQIKQGIELEKSLSPLAPVLCQPDELIQVWTNILHNAVQALDGKGKLRIDLFEENGDVIARFTDNGPGIPAEIQEKIFEPFFTTKPQGEGTGLGLEIARKIILKHHGRIEVRSKPGDTVFTVSIPAVRLGE